MLAVVPAIEFGLIGWLNVHRRQQHSFSGERHVGKSLLVSPRQDGMTGRILACSQKPKQGIRRIRLEFPTGRDAFEGVVSKIEQEMSGGIRDFINYLPILRFVQSDIRSA